MSNLNSSRTSFRFPRAIMFAAAIAVCARLAWPATTDTVQMQSESASPAAAEIQQDEPADPEHAQTGEDEHAGGGGHGDDHLMNFLLAICLMLVVAKLGGDLTERFKQPAVLGELVIGVALGNLVLFGFPAEGAVSGFIEFLKADVVIMTMAEVGVILLLFQIGLESTVSEMKKVGTSAALVAVLGVIVPFFLGYAVSWYFLRDSDPLVHLFVGSVLCATSVGITARVLQDIGKLDTKEAKIIMGAAIIDDVLGLVILAVVMGVIDAKNTGDTLQAMDVALIFLKAAVFFIGSIIVGVKYSPRLFRLASALRVSGVLLTLSLALCFFLSWLAAFIGLAPIVGAFCAGLILEETSFKELGGRRQVELEELITPIAAFLVPLFFVRMGLQVELKSFTQEGVIPFALTLTVVAIIGKQVCTFGVVDKSVDAIAVGLGMIPRGEVGLIVANIGMGMYIGGVRVVDEANYSAIVIMVMITTLITPPFLSWRLRRTGG